MSIWVPAVCARIYNGLQYAANLYSKQMRGPVEEAARRNSQADNVVPGQRLDSWKEIAAYLKRDARTVRRWEKSDRLPVHRHPYLKRGLVYAYKHELDAWWNNGAAAVDTVHDARAHVHVGRTAILGAALLAGVLIVGAFFLASRKTIARAVEATPSIAVLPFVNMSTDKQQEYFSDGLAEELLNDLARIPGLRVSGRTSSFQFKNRAEDPRAVGQKLNVTTVLEGSVRKQGDRVRIAVELIKTADGFHLWSETYDRELEDIFSVQDDIARSVTASLNMILVSQHHASPAVNSQAYNDYLRAFIYRRGDRQSAEQGVAYYQQAVHRDPGFAPAWAGLAIARIHQANYGYLPVTEAFESAREAAARALALDPNLAAGHIAMGQIHRGYDWDWHKADDEYHRALALEPGNAQAMVVTAMMARFFGRFDEARSLAQRAVDADPLSMGPYNLLSRALVDLGRWDEAVAVREKSVAVQPTFPSQHYDLARFYLYVSQQQKALIENELETDEGYRLCGRALTYHALGKEAESEAALAQAIAKYHETMAFQIAEAYAYRGEADQAFAWLDRAYSQRDPGMAFLLRGNIIFRKLEHDPRYIALAQRMHFPQ